MKKPTNLGAKKSISVSPATYAKILAMKKDTGVSIFRIVNEAIDRLDQDRKEFPIGF